MIKDLDVVTSVHYNEETFVQFGTSCAFFSYNQAAKTLLIANILKPGY